MKNIAICLLILISLLCSAQASAKKTIGYKVYFSGKTDKNKLPIGYGTMYGSQFGKDTIFAITGTFLEEKITNAILKTKNDVHIVGDFRYTLDDSPGVRSRITLFLDSVSVEGLPKTHYEGYATIGISYSPLECFEGFQIEPVVFMRTDKEHDLFTNENSEYNKTLKNQRKLIPEYITLVNHFITKDPIVKYGWRVCFSTRGLVCNIYPALSIETIGGRIFSIADDNSLIISTSDKQRCQVLSNGSVKSANIVLNDSTRFRLEGDKKELKFTDGSKYTGDFYVGDNSNISPICLNYGGFLSLLSSTKSEIKFLDGKLQLLSGDVVDYVRGKSSIERKIEEEQTQKVIEEIREGEKKEYEARRKAEHKRLVSTYGTEWAKVIENDEIKVGMTTDMLSELSYSFTLFSDRGNVKVYKGKVNAMLDAIVQTFTGTRASTVYVTVKSGRVTGVEYR